MKCVLVVAALFATIFLGVNGEITNDIWKDCSKLDSSILAKTPRKLVIRQKRCSYEDSELDSNTRSSKER